MMKPQKQEKCEGNVRNWLSFIVVGGSLFGITAVCAVVLFTDSEKAEGILTQLLPLLGTWVGTVLAFYFSRDNFESAQRSLTGLVDRLTPEQKLQSIKATEAMVSVDAMEKVILGDGDNEGTITLSEIDSIIQSKGRSRVPVLNANKSGRYVIHKSTLYEAIVQKKSSNNAGIDMTNTLKDLANFSDVKKAIEAIAWVDEQSTLADAKRKMEATPNCQDVFVTATGDKAEPVLGWVTNVEIQKRSQA